MDLAIDDGGEIPSAVLCSICFDAVTGVSDRSTARLQCGHEFHLDCIGSAFNAKGVMQCPNCRKVEKGNWLYANGSYSLPEPSSHEWMHDEDLYEPNYSELPYGVHWCPYSTIAQIASTFEEGESSHLCPYFAYIHPIQMSSTTSTSHVVTGNVIGPTFRHRWSSPTRALPAIDLHYNSWEHHPTYSTYDSHASGRDQASVSSSTTRAGRLDSDGQPITTPLVHPFVIPHRSSASRPTGSTVPSVAYLNNSGGPTHVYEHYQHQGPPGLHGTFFAGSRHPGGSRGLPSIGPAPPPPTEQNRFPYMSPHRIPRGAEGTEGNRFYAWESDPLAPFPLMRVDRELGWWGPQRPNSSGLSDSGSRAAIWPRYGAERSSVQGRSEGSSYRTAHAARMWPFI